MITEQHEEILDCLENVLRSDYRYDVLYRLMQLDNWGERHMSLESLDAFACFIITYQEIGYPGICLTHDGILSVTWRDSSYRVHFVFKSKFEVVCVLLDLNKFKNNTQLTDTYYNVLPKLEEKYPGITTWLMEYTLPDTHRTLL